MNCKDINDLVLSGKNTQQIVKMIDGNVFSGVKAKFMLNQWKKMDVKAHDDEQNYPFYRLKLLVGNGSISN